MQPLIKQIPKIQRTRHRRHLAALFAGMLLLLFQGQVLGQDTAGIEESNFSTVRVLIIPEHHAVLASEISARISSVRVKMGDRFKAGQALVVMDTGLYEARVQRADAEFRAADEALAIHTKLSAMGSMSELEMLAARARLETARADLDLEKFQQKLGIIRAPFDGWVVKQIVNPHEYAVPGQPLIEIIDQHLRLQLHVPSVWLRWLRPRMAFRMDVDETGKSYPAKITRLGGQVDPVSQTIEVWGKITENHGDLVAGMSGLSRFEVPKIMAP